MNKGFKIIVVLITVAASLMAAMFGVYAMHQVAGMSVGNTVILNGLDEETENVGMVNVLLIGVDEDGTRSDTIMLVSIDGYSNRVSIISIPRDTMVKPEGYGYQKINALIGIGQAAVKKGTASEPEEILVQKVKDVTGLPINYFVSVDFDGFKDIIDAVDGVDFNVPYDMNYDDPAQNLHIHLKAGQQHLDGQAAHDFVRFRHNNSGSAPGEYAMGDEGREYWQQEFIKELVKQKMKPQYLTKIDDIFEVVCKNVRTNYKMQDLLSHLDLIQKVDITCIGSYQLPGESKYFRADGQADTLWWYLYDEEETRNLINSVFLPKTEQEWEAYKAEHGEEIASGDAGFGTISEMHRNSKSNQSSTKAEGVEDMSGTSQSSSKSSSSATVIGEG